MILLASVAAALFGIGLHYTGAAGGALPIAIVLVGLLAITVVTIVKPRAGAIAAIAGFVPALALAVLAWRAPAPQPCPSAKRGPGNGIYIPVLTELNDHLTDAPPCEPRGASPQQLGLAASTLAIVAVGGLVALRRRAPDAEPLPSDPGLPRT